MLILQSIQCHSHKGTQTYAVGPNNIYLPIYEVSPPQITPFLPNSKNTVLAFPAHYSLIYKGLPKREGR